MEQLEERLSAEQADAVAIGIQAFDDGMGFVEADATGLGKGRVAATLAVYGKKLGKKVMFMTEKSDLLSDFYRDVEDIGCMGELGNRSSSTTTSSCVTRPPAPKWRAARSGTRRR
jgi:hypothetical protein